jgi:hypothetical protein
MARMANQSQNFNPYFRRLIVTSILGYGLNKITEYWPDHLSDFPKVFICWIAAPFGIKEPKV